MNTYLKFYRWAMGMKLRMGLYTVAAVFFKALWNLSQGNPQVDSRDLLTLWIASTAFAMVESAILPGGGLPSTRGRNCLWVLTANVIFCGGAMAMKWFEGISHLGAAGLVLVLELILWAMWFGDNVAMRMDTKALNDGLRRFQSGQK